MRWTIGIAAVVLAIAAGLLLTRTGPPSRATTGAPTRAPTGEDTPAQASGSTQESAIATADDPPAPLPDDAVITVDTTNNEGTS